MGRFSIFEDVERDGVIDMASEELQQRYPDGNGYKIGEFEVFETQLTTLRQFGEHGILPNKDYGALASQKCDSLIIRRLPVAHSVAIGEHKKPGVITNSNWKVLAKDLIDTKCHPTETLIGYLTDGIRTWWCDILSPMNRGASKCL